jgi:hypothetical protein
MLICYHEGMKTAETYSVEVLWAQNAQLQEKVKTSGEKIIKKKRWAF